MKTETINGVTYKLPNVLNDFQKDLYVHLINWKWKNITKEPGKYSDDYYDAILPESVHKNFPVIYPDILQDLKLHQNKFPFKLHEHFNHMASSQAANVNLFLPVLLNTKANDVLKNINSNSKIIKSDFNKLANNELYKGFRIEFWDGNSSKEKGILKDHNARSGTDSDIAIAYYNHDNELCLWLIEHKLTEKEFTECGGYKSKGRDEKKHLCGKPYNDVLKDKNLCYYHDIRKFKYWDITDTNKSFFANADKYDECPFRGGMNQLWRNQLLGLAIENDINQPYKHVYFSVVKHPGNTSLDQSINEYMALINNNPKFSVFDSTDVLNAAQSVNDTTLNKWIKWYKGLYKI